LAESVVLHRSGIRRKIILLICCAVFLIAGAGLGMRYTFGYALLIAASGENQAAIAQTAVISLKQSLDAHALALKEYLNSSHDQPALEKLQVVFEPLASSFPRQSAEELIVTDSNNNILFCSRPELLGRPFLTSLDRQKFTHAVWAPVNLPYLFKEESLAASSPLSHPLLWAGGGPWKVYLVRGRQAVLAPLAGMKNQAVALALFLLFTLIPLGVIFSSLFLRPVRKLMEASRKIRDGQWDARVDIKTGDEFEALAGDFNDMAAAIREKQSRLLQEKAYLDGVVASINAGVIVLDDSGALRVLNPRAKELLGFNPEQEVDQESLFRRLGAIGLDQLIAQARADQTILSKETALPWQDKRTLWCEAAAVKDSGKFQGTLVSLRDVTKDRIVDQMKTDFISMVSHELRTPLATIKEGVNLVLDRSMGGIVPAQEKILAAAFKNISRLERIIDDLLDVSKIEAGKMDLRRQAVNLSELAKTAAATFEFRLKEKGLRFVFKSEPPQIMVYADADKLTQVFINLLGNAVKFTRQGQISVELQEQQSQVLCVVADSGPGIKQEDLPRVFSKFQQFNREAGSGEKGTGLGLSIAQGIVRLHRGEIKVESEYGKGTKFIFTLPRYSAEDVLLDEIERGIASAKKDRRDLSLFIYRLENLSGLEKEFGPQASDSVFTSACAAFGPAAPDSKIFILADKKEIVVLAKIDSRDAPVLALTLKRAMKESFFETAGAGAITFFHGWAAFPQDASSALELLSAARDSSVDERLQRLDKKILVVDDEETIVKIVARLLNAAGYRHVNGATDPQAALALIEQELPDLIILDMKMPGMSGYELVGRLKENLATKDLPVLIMSGYEVDTGHLKEYIKRKAILTVGKPLQADQLEKLVEHLL